MCLMLTNLLKKMVAWFIFQTSFQLRLWIHGVRCSAVVLALGRRKDHTRLQDVDSRPELSLMFRVIDVPAISKIDWERH